MSTREHPFDPDTDGRSESPGPIDVDPMLGDADRTSTPQGDAEENREAEYADPGVRYLLTSEFGFW
ncbi:MAG: hypothetical protein ACQETB_03985 [Halobacteriota archaeon]